MVLAVIFCHQLLSGQTIISGKVKDGKGRPIAGASIALKNTYDGATSDSAGAYKFSTAEKGPQSLLITSVGYKLLEQPIDLRQENRTIDITLKEEPNELRAVTITAGSFEA